MTIDKIKLRELAEAATLNEKGQCCGRKPIVYKRPRHHLFCDRCCRSYDGKSLEQIENWAWKRNSTGGFVKVARGSC